ncbi:AraC family transcriptional regulator [Oceanicoccus sp. KOV_DT_Chl]|uniref:AraC family transcriptional regulator n=1 Tax=Oceanicoccus sp. KOV_DT_Chl TaxID=1904639 RepID=UPI000C7DD33C|nr:AraC family transcriptional regulator [Oceanicoccus sp. KOV_DT_Chl]
MPANDKQPWDGLVLHPLYSEILLYLAGAHGVSVEQLCDDEQMQRLKSRQNPRWFVALLLKLLEEKPSLSSIGFEFGEHLDLASAGVIGQAVSTAPTLGLAFDLMSRYYPLTGMYLDIDRQRVMDDIIVTVDTGYDDVPQQVKTMVLEAVLVSWNLSTKLLCGVPLPVKQLCFDYPEPAHGDKYREYFNCDIQFDSFRSTLTVDTAVVALPIVTSNPVVHQRAVSHCEAALLRQGITQTVTNQTRRIIKLMNNLPEASLDIVASRLNISPRTLNRRLQEEGVGFKVLLDEQRCQRACLLLAKSDYNMDQIAEQLGYSDSSNFRRAFKKWTGATPTHYRKGSD